MYMTAKRTKFFYNFTATLSCVYPYFKYRMGMSDVAFSVNENFKNPLAGEFLKFYNVKNDAEPAVKVLFDAVDYVDDSKTVVSHAILLYRDLLNGKYRRLCSVKGGTVGQLNGFLEEPATIAVFVCQLLNSFFKDNKKSDDEFGFLKSENGTKDGEMVFIFYEKSLENGDQEKDRLTVNLNDKSFLKTVRAHKNLIEQSKKDFYGY